VELYEGSQVVNAEAETFLEVGKNAPSVEVATKHASEGLIVGSFYAEDNRMSFRRMFLASR
jgi:hypothetical protein